MPRDGAIIFADLIGKLDLLRIACDKCGRDGCYGLYRLIERRGRNAASECDVVHRDNFFIESLCSQKRRHSGCYSD